MAGGVPHPVTATGTIDPGVPAALRLVRVSVPLRRPHRWAGGSAEHRDVVLVRWTRPDGAVGWGECPTLDGYVTGTTAAAWSALVASGDDLLAGRAGPSPDGGWRGPVEALPAAARGAVADAALDAALRSAGRPLVEHLGAQPVPLRRTSVVGGPRDAAATRAAAALDAVAGGAAMVKLKVDAGTRPEDVAEVVRAVGGTPVAADANGTLGPDARRFDALGLAYLEQPFAPGDDWAAQAARRAGLRTPVALDEPLGSPDDVAGAVAAGAAVVVSVKPARLGGVVAAAAAARLAAGAGVGTFVGGMVELGVHRAAAAALAALVASLDGSLPTDLGPSSAYVALDVATPTEVDADGRLRVPPGPGTGVEVDEELVGRLATAVWDGGA